MKYFSNSVPIYFLLIFYFSCKQKEDANWLQTPKCTCNTALDGYVQIFHSGDCNCETTSGLFGCITKVTCQNNIENKIKEVISMGDSLKWERARSYLISSNDLKLKEIGQESRSIKYSRSGTIDLETNELIARLNEKLEKYIKNDKSKIVEITNFINKR